MGKSIAFRAFHAAAVPYPKAKKTRAWYFRASGPCGTADPVQAALVSGSSVVNSWNEDLNDIFAFLQEQLVYENTPGIRRASFQEKDKVEGAQVT